LLTSLLRAIIHCSHQTMEGHLVNTKIRGQKSVPLRGFEPSTLGLLDDQLGLKVTHIHCKLVVVNHTDELPI